MLVMTGASASGKTEIAKIIIKKYNFKKMVTYTTRVMRQGEVNGIDYHFLSKDAFLAKEVKGEFLETTEYNHHYYGTSFKDASREKVLIVDINGANKLFEKLGHNVTLFFLESPQDIREERMLKRGDKPDDIKKRLQCDAYEFNPQHMQHIDYVIDTGDLSLDVLADDIYSLYQNHILKEGSHG